MVVGRIWRLSQYMEMLCICMRHSRQAIVRLVSGVPHISRCLDTTSNQTTRTPPQLRRGGTLGEPGSATRSRQTQASDRPSASSKSSDSRTPHIVRTGDDLYDVHSSHQLRRTPIHAKVNCGLGDDCKHTLDRANASKDGRWFTAGH